MTKGLSPAATAAVKEIVREAEANNQIVDAYGVAERVRRSFPDEEFLPGEVIAVMLNFGLQAVELAPAPLVIEIILPPEAPGENKDLEERPSDLRHGLS
jgi:hypothetical protein